MSAIQQIPVSVAIEADQNAHTGGIIKSGCGTNLDHGVLAVGYDSSQERGHQQPIFDERNPAEPCLDGYRGSWWDTPEGLLELKRMDAQKEDLTAWVLARRRAFLGHPVDAYQRYLDDLLAEAYHCRAQANAALAKRKELERQVEEINRRRA